MSAAEMAAACSPYIAAPTLPNSHRIGGESLAMRCRDSVGPHPGVDTVRDSSSPLAQHLRNSARGAGCTPHHPGGRI